MFLFLTLISLLIANSSNALTPDQIQRVDKLVQDVFMTQNRIPGLGLTIVENSGNEIYSRGYGLANIANTVPVTRNTKFCIASISKTFTATLIMKVLSERFPLLGASVLETPLRKLYPNGNFTFSDRFRSETMSFRDLLSHRHALKTESLGSGAGAFKDIEEFTFRSRYATEVGPFRATGYYSNTLYALAGKLIAEIAQQPFESLLQDFFNELGMNSSILIGENTDLEGMRDMSKGYFMKDGAINQLNSLLLNRVFVGAPAGGIITTPEDMSKYITFHLNLGKVGQKQVISEEAMLWLRYPALAQNSMQFKTSESSLVSGAWAVGTGFLLGVHDGWSFINHNGQWVTFLSELRIYPDAGFGSFSVVNGPFDFNSGIYSHAYLHNEIFNIAQGLETSPIKNEDPYVNALKNAKIMKNTRQKEIIKSNSVNLTQDSFLGVFGNPIEGELEITNPNGTLYISFGKWATGYLHPYNNNTFTINWDSDFIQEIYFGGSGILIDIFLQFNDNDNADIIFLDSLITFKRGVNLDSLPVIPWDPNSCSVLKFNK